jgi:DNA-binding MarR family transcriptional regulator
VQPPPSRHGGVPRLIIHVAREWRTALERELSRFDITSTQAVLLILLARQPASPNQLTAELGTDTAGISRLVDRLEGKGYVARAGSPHDRRAIVLELTPAGRAVVPQVMPIIGAARARLLAGFSSEETEALETLLQRLRANLSALDSEAGRVAGRSPSRG